MGLPGGPSSRWAASAAGLLRDGRSTIPPGRAAGVYPEEAPSAGAGCRLGWLGGQGGGPQGGADYLLVSQVVYAEERMLLPGAVFS